MGEEGEEEEEEGHLVWRVHKRLAVLSHKICWKGCVSLSPWLELVSHIACGKCGEGALAFKKDLSSSKQTNGQNQETGFWKHDGTNMTNSLDSLLFRANVSSPIMKWLSPTSSHFHSFPPLSQHLCFSNKSIYNFSSCPQLPTLPLRGTTEGWPQWPITQQQHNSYWLAWRAARPILLTLPITSLGTQRDTLLVPKNQNKLGSWPKSVQGGFFVGTVCVHSSAHPRARARAHTHKHRGKTHVHPLRAHSMPAKAKW